MIPAAIHYMTVGDVAKRLDLQPTTVHRLVAGHKLRVAAVTMGGILLFLESDVEQLREARRLNPPRRGRPPRAAKQVVRAAVPVREQELVKAK